MTFREFLGRPGGGRRPDGKWLRAREMQCEEGPSVDGCFESREGVAGEFGFGGGGRVGPDHLLFFRALSSITARECPRCVKPGIARGKPGAGE